MPLFEYRCRVCSHRFETLQLGSAAPACPSCHGADLEKLLSTFAVSAGRVDAPRAAGPCGQCGHADGPGACRFEN